MSYNSPREHFWMAIGAALDGRHSDALWYLKKCLEGSTRHYFDTRNSRIVMWAIYGGNVEEALFAVKLLTPRKGNLHVFAENPSWRHTPSEASSELP